MGLLLIILQAKPKQDIAKRTAARLVRAPPKSIAGPDEILENVSAQASAGDEDMMESNPEDEVSEAEQDSKLRKRKRKDDNDNLESDYLERLTREEQKQQPESQVDSLSKRTKLSADAQPKESTRPIVMEEEDAEEHEIPKHETLGGTEGLDDLDKSNRTVFLGNVSIEAISSKAAKKTLIQHLSSFLSELSVDDVPHKVESLRFRSTAFSNRLSKKASFVRKDLMESTTKSTNAYAVYSTPQASIAAARKLNGTVVLDRHLRADHITHPQKTDHKRCVFVGNLDFVDDENPNPDLAKPRKKKTPGDVEEGLWRQFGNAGTVESVRVVRDSKTRVGKGFAYVQFTVRLPTTTHIICTDIP